MEPFSAPLPSMTMEIFPVNDENVSPIILGPDDSLVNVPDDTNVSPT